MDERLARLIKNSVKNYPNKHLIDDDENLVTLSIVNSYNDILCTVKIEKGLDEFSMTCYIDDLKRYRYYAKHYGEECEWKHEFVHEPIRNAWIMNILSDKVEKEITNFFDNYDPKFEYEFNKEAYEGMIESEKMKIDDEMANIIKYKDELEEMRTCSFSIIWNE